MAIEVYVTDIEGDAIRNEREVLLIYAHSPLYNSSTTGTPLALAAGPGPAKKC